MFSNLAGLGLSSLALLSLALVAGARAAPPVGNRDGLGKPALSRSLARLDLRPPELPVTRSTPAATAPFETPPFPSMRQAQPGLRANVEDQLPALGSGRVESRAQEIARHVQHEGVPLARLWQNHSAMVSLGLNQRGKPGLWLIQKIP
jgi:hypothetical protein